ncbi:hypothetical protein [Tsukamurella tyrosinosolvens]|uniref:hypothetical protein n=1 Tax=Tsukamurella tyrosinosolvens TaxID=57704 RepID=UPI002DD43A3E|nr:hypothetical protein [Tsukamurella tyrosinosolvens]MEC4616275.1 hypothetical protein [Tsukamurella tyrosinosolvens]
MSRIRAWIGKRLRFAADRIDYEHSVRISGLTFTFEQGEGIVLHGATLGDPMRGFGCPVVYFAHEYDRAHTEARSGREPWPLPRPIFDPKQWEGDANRCTCTALMTGPTILCPVHRSAT